MGDLRNMFIRPAASAEGTLLLEPNLLCMNGDSVDTYDAGWRAANGEWTFVQPEFPSVIQQIDYDSADPFHTLKHNNVAGNKYRFTRPDGSQITTTINVGDEFIDHLTGRVYKRGSAGTYRTWAAASSLYQASGFYLPTDQERWTLKEVGNNNCTIEGTNMEVSTQNPWTCCTYEGDSTQAVHCGTRNEPIYSKAKTSTSRTGTWVKIWDGALF